MLQALLFDVDGTLAETEEAHRCAFNAAFAAAGLGWSWDRELYRELLAVAGGRERIRYYIERAHPALLSRPDLERRIGELHTDKNRRYAALVAAGEVRPRPGVARLVAEARETGLRLAIATTTSRANVEALLAACFGTQGQAVFEVIGAGEDVGARKPAPDIYHRVLARLGLEARSALAIEDSANGVAAARAAGVPVLVTESSYSAGEDFAGAVAVISDLGEPGLPLQLRAGAAPVRPWVDVEQLRAWHAEANRLGRSGGSLENPLMEGARKTEWSASGRCRIVGRS